MANTLTLPADLAKGSLVLVAVSGGGDSVFLAHELAAVSASRGLRLHVAHVNHGRRGADDAADAAFVGELATSLGAGFSPLALPSPVEGSHSLEERLRAGRLTVLNQEAKRLGAAGVAFGHTADDLAETFLLMALRGSGPTGLGSLRVQRWSAADQLWHLRPLLQWSRAEIRAALRQRGLDWREDPTNEEPMHRRNRLRSGIMPLLMEEEPAAVELLARSATLCAEASDLLEELAQEDLQSARVQQSEGVLLLSTHVLRQLSAARLAILLRVAWRQVSGGRFPLPPPKPLVDSLAARIHRMSGEPSFFFDGGAHARVDDQQTLLYAATLPPDQALQHLMPKDTPVIQLPTPSSVVPVANSSQRATPFQSRIILPGEQGTLAIAVTSRDGMPDDWSPRMDADPCIAYLDPLSLRRDLVLRTAADGETLPMGAAGSKSAADALQEAGIPAKLRARVAVLADDRGILWIPGVRRAVSAYITDRSTLVLRLQWHPSPNLEILG